jgi:hypothetical protein
MRDLTQKPLRKDEVPLIIINQKSADFLLQLEPLKAGIERTKGKGRTTVNDKPSA